MQRNTLSLCIVRGGKWEGEVWYFQYLSWLLLRDVRSFLLRRWHNTALFFFVFFFFFPLPPLPPISLSLFPTTICVRGPVSGVTIETGSSNNKKNAVSYPIFCPRDPYLCWASPVAPAAALRAGNDTVFVYNYRASSASVDWLYPCYFVSPI